MPTALDQIGALPYRCIRAEESKELPVGSTGTRKGFQASKIALLLRKTIRAADHFRNASPSVRST